MIQDITGKKFGRLVAIKPIGKTKKGETIWQCACDCGNTHNVIISNLNNGHTTSCGCYKKVCSITHADTKTRLYRTWQNMKNRCYNKNTLKYSIYGARGITVCDEWLNDFISFKSWAMGNGYNETLTIDRIDVNGNYEPNNCRWSTKKEQSNNTRSNIIIMYNGERKTAQEWAEQLGVSPKTLRKRYYDKMPTEKILYKGDLRCKKNSVQ